MDLFPFGFRWGAATAAHQVEGNNVNSELWLLEHSEPTVFAEPSLDACDHYHRFPEDIKLLASPKIFAPFLRWSTASPRAASLQKKIRKPTPTAVLSSLRARRENRHHESS